MCNYLLKHNNTEYIVNIYFFHCAVNAVDNNKYINLMSRILFIRSAIDW